KKLGRASFKGNVKGSGFSTQTLDADLDGTFSRLQFNNYNYENIAVNGHMDKKLFKGAVSISDPNLIVTLDGEVNLSAIRPEFNFFADITRGYLKEIGFAKDDMNVIGKFDMNFTGDDIDNFLGTVSLYD